MTVRFDILRREKAESMPYRQVIEYTTDDPNATVATALTALNETVGLTDVEGRPVERIMWECSCLQKKCGACAMRINGLPRLACDTKLKDCGPTIQLEPLKKFPPVADLIVNRDVLHDNLKALKVWLEDEAEPDERTTDIAYEASRCLQCGCCLEVCPNFLPEFLGGKGQFAGTAAMPPLARLIAELPREKKRELEKTYRKRFYEGCGKSLACRNICPAGIDIERLLVNSNAMAVWKRLLRK